jgi:UDP-GlcNAc:undecaprenyl-phosphate/decaprenyl-phosphate GlcNAc-1-phosphate transferase
LRIVNPGLRGTLDQQRVHCSPVLSGYDSQKGSTAIHSLLIGFVTSVFLCALLTRSVRNLAVSRGWTDPPDSSRHLHGGPVPRLGGVALFLTVAGAAGLGLVAQSRFGPPTGFSIRAASAVLGPAALIFLMGLYDDLRSLGPYLKFGVQILAACLLYLSGLGIHQLTLLLGGSRLSGILGLPLTIFWVLLITNAFNLIDGLDGLAAGAALFSTIVLLVASLLGGNHFVAFLAVVLAGAIAGFLRFNFHPATIFLGDSGSLFIGFMLSALALAGSQKASTMVAVAIPVVCFGLPILDVTIAVVRRFLSGKPLFHGDRDHIHHRLLKRGFSQRDAVLILYGVSALFGLLSLALLHGGGTTALVLAVLGIGVCVGIPQLRYQEFAEMRRVLGRTASQKRIIANDLRVRHAVESLRTCEDVSELCRILAGALQPIGFDGFSLKLPSTVRLAQALPVPLRQDPNGELHCFWTMLGSREATWELRLELVSNAGDRCGFFSVYKRLTGKPLLMDINLLSDGFHTALADAVHRAIIETDGGVKNREQVARTGRARVASASSLH